MQEGRNGLRKEPAMRRQFHWDKKYLYWGMTAFFVIAAAILFYMALNYITLLGKALKKIVGILGPFIWGLVLTYLLLPLMRLLDGKVFGPLCRKLFAKNKRSDGRKLSRALAVLISVLVLLAVLVALVYMILPQLYDSIKTIVEKSPAYAKNLSEWVSGLLVNYPEVNAYISSTLDTLNADIVSWISNKLLPSFGSLITNISSGVYSVFRGVYNLVIGIIVSIYLLSDFEHFKAASKRLLYSVFSLESAEKIRSVMAFTDKTFMGFITGKLMDSAIIGVICYIVCAILKMPYALLVSVIVGVTNIIPFFGPLIGAIPATIIILMVSPLKAFIFVVFVIILQQVDGNFIGPKILGNSVGISGFWVMFSIIVGAGLFGFWGMLLGVPIFVVIQALVDQSVARRLKRSDLPVEAEAYTDIQHIDPVTREIIRTPKKTARTGKAASPKPEAPRDSSRAESKE